MLLTLIILTTLCYLAYSVKVMEGIPESLSATYYGLKEDGWLFQALCIGMAFGLLPMWIEACSGEYEYLSFLACGGLGFVGIAPSFKLKLEGMIHYTAAAICCVSAVLWQILMGLWDITLLFGFIGLMLSLQQKNKWCWWLELSVIGSVFVNLLTLI